jgi:hypothetical protein
MKTPGARMAESWVDRYYESLEFFYWEPQHLGRSKSSNSNKTSLKERLKHWEEMEVTLNHILKFFFALAPASVPSRIIELAFGHKDASGLHLYSYSQERELPKWTSCQPDFVFIGSGSTLSLEMKLDHKSSVEQVLKYALLALALECSHDKQDKADDSRLAHRLVFLSKRGFQTLWSRSANIAELDQLRSSIDREIEQFADTHLCKVPDLRPRFESIAREMDLGFITYGQFVCLLESERVSAQGRSEGTYAKLLDGMLAELVMRRELVNPSCAGG